MKKLIFVNLSLLTVIAILASCSIINQEPRWEQQWIYVGYTNSDEIYNSALNSAVGGLPIYKFDTVSELERFKTDFEDDFSFDPPYMEEGSFEKTVEGIDETFFDQYRMYLVYVPSSSGSYQYFIDNVVSDSDAFCIYVKKTETLEENVTADMSGWFVLFNQPKSEVKDYTTYDARMSN